MLDQGEREDGRWSLEAEAKRIVIKPWFEKVKRTKKGGEAAPLIKKPVNLILKQTSETLNKIVTSIWAFPHKMPKPTEFWRTPLL